MTIALGIHARNGVVIATDREESIDDKVKYDARKVRGVFHLSLDGDQLTHRHLLLAGAGWADCIDAFAETLEDGRVLADSRMDAEPRSMLEDRLVGFYKKHILPFAGYPEPDRPDMGVVVGYVSGGRSHLFGSTRTMLKSAGRFVVIGAGRDVAQRVLQRFMPQHSPPRNLSVKEAVVVAAHAVWMAKEVPGVGFDTDILAMFDNGSAVQTGPPIDKILEAALKRYSDEVEPIVMRSIIGTRTPKEALAAIEAVKTELGKILGDSFGD